MANPWMMKNPVVSLWLTAANRVASILRGHATVEARRQLNAMIAESTLPRGRKAKPGRKR